VQKVYKLDNRLRNFERKFATSHTADAKNILTTVFIGWKIADPKKFLQRFPAGDEVIVEQTLESLVRGTKNEVIGQYNFGDLISTNRNRVKLRELEAKMLIAIKSSAHDKYGVDVELVGLKQIGLDENITAKVFERMQSERMKLVRKYRSEGDAEAQKLIATANQQRQKLLAEGESEATRIRGEGEAEAAKHYAVFEQNPELAKFLLDMRALKRSMTNRTTIILDQNTPPFNRLQMASEQLKPTSAKGGH
jgi:membrane protease subunit HflC